MIRVADWMESYVGIGAMQGKRKLQSSVGFLQWWMPAESWILDGAGFAGTGRKENHTKRSGDGTKSKGGMHGKGLHGSSPLHPTAASKQTPDGDGVVVSPAKSASRF